MTLNKLWIFGDSFSAERSAEITYNTWPELLARKLELTQYINHALWGASNDYIFDALLKHAPEFKSGDYVIIQLTQQSRQWFFKDEPTCGNFYMKNIEKFITAQELTAVSQYITHLQRDEIDELRYLQLTLALEHIAKSLSHLRIVILPGYHFVPGVTGTLYDVSKSEFIEPKDEPLLLANHDGRDPRPNHLSQVHHQILADKLFNSWSTGNPIDLTTDFKKGFIEVYA